MITIQMIDGRLILAKESWDELATRLEDEPTAVSVIRQVDDTMIILFVHAIASFENSEQ